MLEAITIKFSELKSYSNKALLSRYSHLLKYESLVGKDKKPTVKSSECTFLEHEILLRNLFDQYIYFTFPEEGARKAIKIFPAKEYFQSKYLESKEDKSFLDLDNQFLESEHIPLLIAFVNENKEISTLSLNGNYFDKYHIYKIYIACPMLKNIHFDLACENKSFAASKYSRQLFFKTVLQLADLENGSLKEVIVKPKRKNHEALSLDAFTFISLDSFKKLVFYSVNKVSKFKNIAEVTYSAGPINLGFAKGVGIFEQKNFKLLLDKRVKEIFFAHTYEAVANSVLKLMATNSKLKTEICHQLSKYIKLDVTLFNEDELVGHFKESKTLPLLEIELIKDEKSNIEAIVNRALYLLSGELPINRSNIAQVAFVRQRGILKENPKLETTCNMFVELSEEMLLDLEKRNKEQLTTKIFF